MKMKTRIYSVGILLLMTWFITRPAHAQDQPAKDDQAAKEIVTKSFNLFLGKSSFGIMKMTVVRPSWQRSIEMQNWSLGDDYYITYITAPAHDRGEVFLKYKKDMWNFIPAINRIVKIPPSMMMQAWMGSDFTNNDLMKMKSVITDYTHQFNGSEKIDGYDCYVIDLKPLPEAPVVWGAIKMWIAKKNLNTLKEEFYNTKGNLVKTETASNLKMMGGRLLPSHLEMVSNSKHGHKTVIDISHQEFDLKNINPNFFSIQHIKNIQPRDL
jgi:outer membrane lipoprotein-sorting protein